MKILNVKFKIIIGIVLFIILICAGYSASIIKNDNSNVSSNKTSVEIGEKVYQGKFLIPVENFIKVTSKYGTRVHPISRSSKKTFRCRFGWN